MNTDNEQKSLDGTGASIEQDLGGHPLFPRPETEYGPDLRKFDLIHIHRLLPDGTKEVCPKVWKGSELRSLEQVVDMYGAECTYRFIAQCGKTYRFQAYSEMFPVSGPARKPFHHEAKRFGETPAPTQQPQPQPQPQQSGLDMTMLFKFMLEREAHASERQAEREMRAAENQARMQEMFMRMAFDRPAPPNPYEGMRDMMQLMQSMNNQQTQAAAPKDSDPVKMLERGIAMGKEMAGEGGGEEIPWGAVINAAATGLSMLKKSKSKEEKETEKHSSKSAKAKESTPPSSKKAPETPKPTAAPLPGIFFDPVTRLPYTYHPSYGFIQLDPAAVLTQMFGHYQAPAPMPHYPAPYPYGVPNMPAPMPTPVPAPQPMPMPVAAPVPAPQPMPMPVAPPIPPPMPIPQPPPQTIRMAPPPRPVPHPVPPPLPAPIPHAPATVRSSRHNTVAVPAAQPARRQAAPAIPPRQPAPHARAVAQAPPQPTAKTSCVPPSSSTNIAAIPNAIDEVSDVLPESIGSDFAEVVNEGMNSPTAQEIMQNPRFLALRDAVSRGEMSADDANDEFMDLLFGSEGGDS